MGVYAILLVTLFICGLKWQVTDALEVAEGSGLGLIWKTKNSSGIWMRRLRKIKNNLVQDNLCRGQDSN